MFSPPFPQSDMHEKEKEEEDEEEEEYLQEYIHRTMTTTLAAGEREKKNQPLTILASLAFSIHTHRQADTHKSLKKSWQTGG